MAIKVEKYQAASGELFNSEFEADKHDLTAFMIEATGNAEIAKKVVSQIVSKIKPFSTLIKAIYNNVPPVAANGSEGK